MIMNIGEQKFNEEINFLEIVKKLRKLDIILKSNLISKKIQHEIDNDVKNYIELEWPQIKNGYSKSYNTYPDEL